MAVVALTSARGAPGVTTTALAMAMLWPRPVVLVEADVAGSSSILAGYLRGTVPPDRGLVSLAVTHRRGVLDEKFYDQTVALIENRVRLVPGLVNAQQAASMDKLWSPLSIVLANLERTGTDVIIDAGRLGMRHGPMPLLRSADAVLVVSRATLPSISAVAAVLDQLRADLSDHGQGEDTLALLMVGQPGVRPTGELYSPRDVRRELGTPVVGTVVFDPVAAEVLHRGAAPGRRFDRSNLMRSARSVAEAADHLAQAHLDRLDPGRTAPENRGRNV